MGERFSLTRKYHWGLLVLSVLPCVQFSSTTFAEDSPRPNILYFYVDDMGWGSIGPNGQAERQSAGLPYVRTPNLDQLAREGINFRRGYGCFVCSPARSSQQSGFHQGHTFADRNDPDNAKKAMRADDILIGETLLEAGYTTGYWGKWGYGGSKDLNNPTIDNIQTLPTSHGYQHVLAELHHVRAHTFFQPTLWHAPAPDGSVGGLHLVPNSMAGYQNNAVYPSEPALQNHPDYPATAYCDDMYALAALDFVRAQGTKYNQTGTPFFGLLAVQIPHAPFGEIEKLPEWDRVYQSDRTFQQLSPQTRQWAAMVTRIDAHFGNILDALRDPNQDGDHSDSIVANTLVVFQSDNGGPGGKNLQELDANGGLRGTKGRIQEGGIRVPLVIRWPAKIHAESKLRAGTNSNMVVDVTDLLPTFCELAGATPPLSIDGVSIAPTLQGSGHQRPRDFIIHEASNGQSIIQGDYKLVRGKKPPLELYDLESDPAEAHDIADEHPELVQELESLLLGERVTEPKGFANTYHHWVASDGDDVATPDHWSDYEYSNAGVTYMTDRGGPKSSWTAVMENSSDKTQTAIARQNLEFLGLEIKGNQRAEQRLKLTSGVELSGRNEVRIARGGHLILDDAELKSLRWVDIYPGGRLSGRGRINADVYNAGTIELNDEDAITIDGDLYARATGAIRFTAKENGAPIEVAGIAHLDGQVTFQPDAVKALSTGETRVILRAKRIEGKFAGLQPDGAFRLQYTRKSVTLRKN